jgi:tetratricopeptide (TPR) repeat protein
MGETRNASPFVNIPLMLATERKRSWFVAERSRVSLLWWDAKRYAEAEQAQRARAELGFEHAADRWEQEDRLARILDAQGRTEEAVAVLEETLSHEDPSYAASLYGPSGDLAHLSQKLGRPVKKTSPIPASASFSGSPPSSGTSTGAGAPGCARNVRHCIAIGFPDVSRRRLSAAGLAYTLDALDRTEEGVAVLEEALGHQDRRLLPHALAFVEDLVLLSNKIGRPVDAKWLKVAAEVAADEGVALPAGDTPGEVILALARHLGSRRADSDNDDEESESAPDKTLPPGTPTP